MIPVIKLLRLTWLSSVLVLLACSPLNSGDDLPWSSHFEAPDWMTSWHIRTEGSWGQENFQVIADPSEKFEKILRVAYPAGSASPAATRDQDAPSGGGQFYADLDITPRDALRLSYYVRFSNNFNFVKGGEVTGAIWWQCHQWGDRPDGTNGFSTRFMWRRGGAGEVYAYLPSSEDYGTSIGRGNWQFRPGVWYYIEQQVMLNHPQASDGSIQVWLDGDLVLEQDDLKFRTTNRLQIEGIFFSTFFGGNDTSWATPQDVYVDFASFSVSPATSTSLAPVSGG
ncbi:MAG: hypothetical protein HC772_13785 [Leptolyngbyaceae cyanobacterium CRU_2_3]|nr:hypothetical protein [Leptolyngbyaceae cyanobacterium CRU_2_3]